MERYYWFVLEDHSPAMLLTTIITQWTPKVLYEVSATPFTYDVQTNFSPIVLLPISTDNEAF
jgi:hypothetical protein